MEFQEALDRGNSPSQRVVIQANLRIVYSAGRNQQVAIDGRKAPRLIGKCEWRNGIERLKHVARSRNKRASEGRIEIIGLGDFPGDQILRLAVSDPVEQPLGNGVHEIVGVSECFVLVEK